MSTSSDPRPGPPGGVIDKVRLSWRFFSRGLADITRNQSILPSSRFLVRAMLAPINWEAARTVVELGPGTGPMTDLIVARLRPDARLFAIELDEHHVETLKRRFTDPRVTIIHGDAAQAAELLRAHGAELPVDAVISSLGLSMIPGPIREAILRGVVEVLRPGGLFTQYNYLITKYVVYNPGAERSQRWYRFDARPFVRNYFTQSSTRTVTLNVPPATVLTCRKE